MSDMSSYPPPVQKVLRRLQQAYGDTATELAVQALEVFAQIIPGDTHSPRSSVLSKIEASLLRTAYTQCSRQTGERWVNQALLYNAVRTIEPRFTYKPEYKTWPKFLLAQTAVFETQTMKEQLYVRVISPPPPHKTSS